MTGSRRAFGDGETIARAAEGAPSARDRADGLGGRRRLASWWPRSPPTCASPTAWWWCRRASEAAFLAPLPMRRLWGVGPKMEESLREAGRRTPSATWPRSSRSGSSGGWAARPRPAGAGARHRRPAGGGRGGRGQEHRPGAHLRRRTPPTSARLRRTLLELADGVARRLRQHGLRGAHGHAQVPRRDVPHRHARRDAERADRLGRRAVPDRWGLFQGVHGQRKVRLLGVSASRLRRAARSSACSRDPASPADRLRDALASRFGTRALTRASLPGARAARTRQKPR